MKTNAIAIATLNLMADAWNSADGALFGMAFMDDADFVDIRGDYHKSKIAITKGHQLIFDTIYKGSSITYETLQVRTINESVLLLHARQILKAPTGPLAGTHETTLTFVLIKLEEGWKIMSCHNTLVAAHTISW